MRSTEKCIIRINTPDLWKKLDSMGYIWWNCYDSDLVLITTSLNFKYLISYSMPDELTPVYLSIPEEDLEEYRENGYIDCGTNEKLFLALSALREDSDRYQWFVNMETGHWIYCTQDKWQGPEDYHKATVGDLIAYFYDNYE